MWYNSKHTWILSSEEGYDKVFDQYKDYHKHLDSFYDLDIERFLPRDTQNLDIIDLWAGDGRMYKHFDKININSYTSCDISSKLLALHPTNNKNIKNTKIVVCDLETTLPFDDESFDMVTSFFVLEHLNDLNFLFWEIHRILKPGGKVIIWHFLQRREFEWSVWTWDLNERFKIKQYRYRLDDIKESAEYNFFNFDYQEIKDKWNKGTMLWYLIICEK